ncbi:hypothetical protein pdam_00010289 [Pocillopora damicornis]|uniref:Alpha-2-macroglobulin bait region domain-containing protein n=1 Tax=Pocillopora damicornis TaxID=46731 RepID=A0A3M6TMQ0_POCDA|nr:hypothetical protein pdam_00010289 [Pocillopora damicornis]
MKATVVLVFAAVLAQSGSLVERSGPGEEIASDGAQFTSDSEGTLKLNIPRNLRTNKRDSIRAKLNVFGGPVHGGLVIQKSEIITIKIPKISVFIQTDKPIYKPGQTVNMRIVGVDENLKPLTGQVKRVSITSPGKVRTMQWDNVDFIGGIVSLKFPLSSQPLLGDWKIEAEVKGEKGKLVFSVDKYVLPKFEVTIKPPSFVAVKSKDIKATVCAQYTYGKPVKGTVSVLFQMKLPDWYWRRKYLETQITTEKEIDGCTDVTIKTEDVLNKFKQYNSYYCHGCEHSKIAINATVKETATGISQNATGTESQIVRGTAKLKFLPSTPKEFKPGMAYSGQVKATKPDGSPMKGAQIKIVIRGRGRRLLDKYFIVPESGLVEFSINGSKIPSNAKSLNLQAKHQQQTLAYYNAKRWYSPSNSYISMKRVPSPLKAQVAYMYVCCEEPVLIPRPSMVVFVQFVSGMTQVTHVGSTAKVKFDFTTIADAKNVTFYYQIFSRGVLVAQGRNLHEMKNYKGKGMFTTSGFVQFAVTQRMVPSSRLLLFYVRDDLETVADNLQIDVEDKLENEVKIRFSDSIRKPGEATSLIITAEPGSQVAVTAVDKSVHLLKGGNELSQDDAIQVLSSQDVGPSGGSDHSGCYNPYWWGGPWQRRRRSFFPGYSKDLDASSAFENSGILYFSDLTIKTAKCETPFRPPYFFVDHPTFRNGPPQERAELSPMLLSPIAATDTPILKKGKQKKTKSVKVRKEFPETWLWTEELIK